MKKRHISPLTLIFVFFEIGFFVTFILLDSLNETVCSAFVKYAAVLFCVCYSAIFAIKEKNLNSVFLFSAFWFTATADLFLLVLNKNYEVGVILFIFAQVFHAIRIYSLSSAALSAQTKGRSGVKTIDKTQIMQKRPFLYFGARGAVALTVFFTVYAIFNRELLPALALAYFTLLLFNLAQSALLSFKHRKFITLAVGFLLFALCDVCVGLFNLQSATGTVLSSSLYRAVTFGMWFFYAPSQTLIALSAYHFCKKD